jgi:hypothetical protein
MFKHKMSQSEKETMQKKMRLAFPCPSLVFQTECNASETRSASVLKQTGGEPPS